MKIHCDKLRELYGAGMTYREIADKLGCGETTVWNAARNCGIKSRSRSEVLRGREFTVEHRQKLSYAKRGDKWAGSKNPNWKGGVSTDNWVARRNSKGVIWRREVIRMAEGKCARCGRKRGEKCSRCGITLPFYVHHKKSFADHPDKRYDANNGELLCFYCHKEEHGK